MIQAPIKLILIALWIALCVPFAWVAKKLGKPAWRDKVSEGCYRVILLLAGIRLKVIGKPANAHPLLLAANHSSYLDVVILGAHTPSRFLPKSEVARWPAIGGICRLTDAIFIDRRPDKIGEAKAAILSALGRGEMVCLFPESTTGEGRHLLPFKSGFFSLAEQPLNGHELTVQPAAIAYTRIRKLPIDASQWPRIAWYGDMTLLPHLYHLLALGSIDAELIFLPPVTLSQFGDRKKLAEHCQTVIRDAISEARGRRQSADKS